MADEKLPDQVLSCSKRLRDPTATTMRPASVHAKPAAIVPVTIQLPNAIIPTEIRYAAPASISASRIDRKPLIAVVEELQAAL